MKAFTNPEHEPFLFPGDQRAALLIHGFFGTPAEMRPLGKLLNGEGWTVKGILLPGFGPDIETLSRRTYIEWTDAVQSELELLQQDHNIVLLMGNSMGASLAIRVAAHSRPSGLIFLAPFWSLGGFLWPILKLLFPHYYPFKRADLNAPDVRRALNRAFGNLDLDDPGTQRFLREINIPVMALDELRNLGKIAFYTASKVNGVKLVIQGNQDRVVPPRKTKQLVRQFPDPTLYREVCGSHDLVEPEGAGWASVVEQVLEYAGVIAINNGSDQSQI